jgi:hypothetical protein
MADYQEPVSGFPEPKSRSDSVEMIRSRDPKIKPENWLLLFTLGMETRFQVKLLN